MDEKLKKPFDPKTEELAIRAYWDTHDIANPDANIASGYTKKDAPVFSIVLPPPNVTGTLHMGHAAMLAIQDIMVRFHRMRGFRTLWLPGTDHAAIATQSRVEKDLEKEKIRRHDLGRDAFLERVKDFAQKSHDTIVNQVKVMGSSVDWSREAYTLDEKRETAVRTAFKKMYEDGLITRRYRVVNWDPKGQTTISDDELVYEERKAKLYTFKYSKDFPISISTTRPETKVGDTAVAVHPSDERYQSYIGKEYDAVFCGVPIHIKVVADETVEKDFGTGALGVTPAHSVTDWLLSEKHKLPLIQVIDERAKMMVGDDRILGKKTVEAREVIVSWLREEGLLENEEEVVQNVSTAERTGAVVEPLPKLQWFIAVDQPFTMGPSKFPKIPEGSTTTLKALMKHVVEEKMISVLPDRFEKTYFHWIDNLRDWCISRQIWFGHRIPVWYRKDGEDIKEMFVGVSAPSGDGWEQDPDTLDTWFSSGLWTFSTLGWPENTDDLKTYHPTSVLETGYDILFFWVARMILMTTYLRGEIPFSTVYLHGLVRDAQGRKMSKSLGNIIDPLDMADKYGADAVRLSLIIGTGPGNDLKLSEDKIKGYKHFANKIWNATRFVIGETEGYTVGTSPLSQKDKEVYDAFLAEMKDVTDDIEHFRYYLAGEKLYHYFWHTFADKIIEETKLRIRGEDLQDRASAQELLITLLTAQLRLLHPFMPYVTESLWHVIPDTWRKDDRPLALTAWPL
jgi:valyl-tRNA synthetase